MAAGLPDGLPDLLLTEELERALLEPAVENYLDTKINRKYAIVILVQIHFITYFL